MNVCKKILKNKKGFSLMEMVVAVGITGVVSLGVLQLSENQNKIQNHAKSKSAEHNLLKNTRLNLLTSVGCSASLVGRTIVAPPATTSINEIRDHTGRVVISENQSFGEKNNIILSSIELRALSTPVLGDNLLFLDATTTRKTQGEPDKSFTNSILLKVDLDDNNQITRCFTSVGPLTDNLGDQFCSATGGSWDAASEVCTYFCPTHNSGLENQVITSSCLQTKETDTFDTNYIGQNINNTVEGHLNISGGDLIGSNRVTARAQICVGSNCRDFSTKACLGNQRPMRGILGNADLTCHPNALLCSGTTYFAGVNSTGAICRPVPLTACTSTDYYIVEIRSNGTIVCEPIPVNIVTANPDMMVTNITSGGSASYDQDKYLKAKTCPGGSFVTRASSGIVTCTALTDTSVFGTGSCGPNEVLTGYSSTGTPSCASNDSNDGTQGNGIN